jgi:hypothetical protein
MQVLGVPVGVDQPQHRNGNMRPQALTSVKLHLNLLFVILQQKRLEARDKSVTENIIWCQYVMCNVEKGRQSAKAWRWSKAGEVRD